jgi:hypothetical protein
MKSSNYRKERKKERKKKNHIGHCTHKCNMGKNTVCGITWNYQTAAT